MTSALDYVGPAIGALLFVLSMSLVAEPRRQTINAFLVAGACGVYMSAVWVLAEAPALIGSLRSIDATDRSR